ncbi:bifunctional diguanylate cyclase/phosphodiesterase [Vibrio atypicus]|uniref:bifunctional diguanylate cyclase/phosphodiesterase n=1 Tax=Vibrio atypicus TaxID=558271 RepID=UPI00135C6465|nr:EAL domain-containing protein [Vibrio atypicus]
MNRIRLLNLNLQTKTALYFIFGLLGVTLSCLFITRYFFLVSLDSLERMESERASAQANSLINMVVEELESRSYDWAYWDETHELLIEKNADEYRERNLSIDVLDSLGLDSMIFSTLQGENIVSIVREENAAFGGGDLFEHPGIQEHIRSMQGLLDSYRESFSGLIVSGESVWNISITPVRGSEGTSASSGWLIWGENLTFRFPGNFESVLIADNKIELVDPEFVGQASELVQPYEKTEQTITQRISLYDISGLPIAKLSTTIGRNHFIKGSVIFSYLFIAVAVVATFISFTTFLLFRRRVAVRFSDLEKDIDELFAAYQLDGLNQPNKDELDRLMKLVQALANNNSVTQEQLQDAQQKFDALYQSRTISMLLVRGREIVDINQTALELLGYQRDEVINQPLDYLCPDNAQPECQIDEMHRQYQQGETQFEAQMLPRNGDCIDCHLEVSTIQYQGEDALMLSIRDVRESKQQAKLIEDLVERDHLSGLWNRKAIMEKARHLVYTAPNRFSFLYVTIPNLKQVSERYGHQVFDEAMVFIASRFGVNLASYLVGRISEHEFIVLIPSKSECEEAVLGATRLMEELKEKQKIEGIELDLNCAIGLIDPDISHEALDALIHSAIFAIEKNKMNKLPIGIVRIDQEQFEQAQTSYAINNDLAAAIQNGDICAHYQAIVDTKTGNINGFEALARWNHPKFGQISPVVFIPLAEHNDLIVELGESILKQACQFIERLNRMQKERGNSPFSIHVNLSAPHFYHPDLIAYLKQLVIQYHIQPGQLVIEITESMLLGVEQEISNRMDEIKQLGVLFALDDFGTGYSSFSTLCSFPLDIVKLDKSYIDQLETNDRAKSLVRNIANMALELGLTTVAEGVETASQVRKLAKWRIEEIQGYYFYKPQSAEEIEARFERE